MQDKRRIIATRIYAVAVVTTLVAFGLSTAGGIHPVLYLANFAFLLIATVIYAWYRNANWSSKGAGIEVLEFVKEEEPKTFNVTVEESITKQLEGVEEGGEIEMKRRIIASPVRAKDVVVFKCNPNGEEIRMGVKAVNYEAVTLRKLRQD